MREAPTIVLIGAGSTSFGLSTLHDLYADPVFAGATMWLVDLEPAPIERMRQLAGALEAAHAARHHRRAPRPIAPKRCRGADAVVVSVEVDRDRRWQLDFEIPRRHGVEHVLGENAGPGGLAHALRTIPLVAGIARDVERLAPDALLINFTNPEGRICTAFRRHLDQPIIGLCHEVELSRRRFSDLLGRADRRAAPPASTISPRSSTRATPTPATTSPPSCTTRSTSSSTVTARRTGSCATCTTAFGVVIATSDSHAGEYYREAVEHAPPKDFLDAPAGDARA